MLGVDLIQREIADHRKGISSHGADPLVAMLCVSPLGAHRLDVSKSKVTESDVGSLLLRLSGLFALRNGVDSLNNRISGLQRLFTRLLEGDRRVSTKAKTISLSGKRVPLNPVSFTVKFDPQMQALCLVIRVSSGFGQVSDNNFS